MNIYKLELHLPYVVSCIPVSMEINTAGTGGLAYTRRIRNFTYNGKGKSSNNNMQLCAAACHAVVKCKGKRLRRFLAIRVANNCNNTTNNKQINIPSPKRSQMTMTRFWFTLQ